MPDINHNKIIRLLLFSRLAGLFAYAGATRAAEERQVAGQAVVFKGGLCHRSSDEGITSAVGTID